VVISNTVESPAFKPNPLLPDTRSEMAIPLVVGDKVVGVLDMQSTRGGALDRDILPAFEALAGQIAIAIQNANFLAETQQARAEVEAQARRLVRANWREYLNAIDKPETEGFVFEKNQVVPTSQSVQPEVENSGALTAPIAITGEEVGNLIVEMEGESPIARTQELVNSVANLVAQHIESLRLLESAERYRAEMEEASRRTVREDWKKYAENAEELGYHYDLKEVRPMKDNAQKAETSAVPLKIREEVIGNLAVQGLDVSDKESFDLVNAVAERLSAHIESLRQSSQTQTALAQTQKLSDAGLLFTRAADLQEVVKIAVETLGISKINRAVLETFNYNSANEITGTDVIANWWNGNGLEPTAVGTHYTPETLPLLTGLFRTPSPVFIEDAFLDKRIDAVSIHIVRNLNIHAVAGLPLFIADRQIGILLLEADESHRFNEDEMRLFSAMAPQIATVLENRRQFERARQQAEREAMLNVIGQKIQSATTVEAVLQIAARELGHALGTPMTVAQLSMKDQE
jgi:GAF domain-containing protein